MFRTDFRTDGFSGWVITQVIVFIGGTAGHRTLSLSGCFHGNSISQLPQMPPLLPPQSVGCHETSLDIKSACRPRHKRPPLRPASLAFSGSLAKLPDPPHSDPSGWCELPVCLLAIWNTPQVDKAATNLGRAQVTPRPVRVVIARKNSLPDRNLASSCISKFGRPMVGKKSQLLRSQRLMSRRR